MWRRLTSIGIEMKNLKAVSEMYVLNVLLKKLNKG